ncbi:unannotated protein [freshwater metagenome]|uniref:Unannotated protein n=1 Tax=freshwater metagenome TaxID=449393 RepID=A0A6J6LB64_9ZZZZ
MIGGSAGFITMMAFEVDAPPISRSAALVVTVNSSIFARVPGPAESEAIVETISA